MQEAVHKSRSLPPTFFLSSNCSCHIARLHQPRIPSHFKLYGLSFHGKNAVFRSLRDGRRLPPPHVSHFQRRNALYATCLWWRSRLVFLTPPPIKARWGRDGGLGGKDYGNAFPSERLGPLAPAATEWRPQSVPVATKEATGIDSRDEGFPFPPNNLRIGLTGSRAAAGLSQGRRYRRGRAAAESADQGRTRLPQGGPAAAAWWQAGPA